jgi:hypothetical protein
MITRSDIRSFPSLREKENDYACKRGPSPRFVCCTGSLALAEGVVLTFEKASKSSQQALSKLIEKLDKLSEQS